MTRVRRIVLTGLVVLFAATGCASLERELERRTPEATVESARLAGLGFDAARLLLDVRVDNPNAVSVELAGLDYELSVNGDLALSGDSKERSTIPADGSGRVALPITLDYRQLYDRVAGLRGRDAIDYGVDLGVTVDIPLLGKRRLPASVSGSIPIPQRPQISLADLRLERLTLDGARMILDVEVGNPNAFDLALSALRYDLDIDGNNWASGSVNRASQVSGGGRQTISIPLDLDFASIGSGIRRMLLEGEQVRYGLRGALAGTAGETRLGDFELDFDENGELDL